MKRRSALTAVGLVLLLAVFGCGTALAQAAPVRLEGKIVDPLGASVAHATIIVTNAATGLVRKTKSDEAGRYAIAALPSGHYLVAVQRNGFHRPTREMALGAAPVAVADFKLTVSMGESIFWTASAPLNQHEVTALFFLDPRHGWIAVEDRHANRSYLFRTTDGGNHWKRLNVPHAIRLVDFIDSRSGWALTRGMLLLRSGDGGSTWTSASSKPLARSPEEIDSFASRDGQHGWFLSNGPYRPSFLYETPDGGRTMLKVGTTPKDSRYAFGTYARAGIGVWLYGFGFALRSNDEGKSWQEPPDLRKLKTDRGVLAISDARFFPDGRGYLAGRSLNGIILSTTDFGRRWRLALDSQVAANFQSIWFSSGKNGCAVGNFPSVVVCTNDGGSTWRRKTTLRDAMPGFYRSIVLLRSGRGWVLHDGGYLYQTTDGGRSWHAFDPLSATGQP